MLTDEFHRLPTSPEEKLALQRHMRHRTYAGFATHMLGGEPPSAIAEAFDERYDTEVGGTSFFVRQAIRPDGSVEVSDAGRRPRPSRIVDYHDGGRSITPEEAEGRRELAAVLARLREREATWTKRAAAAAKITAP